MKYQIRISEKSSTPKYEQLVNEIIRLISEGNLKLGDKLPSIHEICNNVDIARDTVITAYNELKAKGIIAPRHGKGFYVVSTAVKNKLAIFLLFDVMNGYKEVLYRSLIKALGPDYRVDIFFHYYNLKVFKELISNNRGKYGYYVIMPHFNEDVSDTLKSIPESKLLIIDKPVDSLRGNYNAVYQDFRNDILSLLRKRSAALSKYSRFIMISNRNFQFIPDDMERGFRDYCKETGFRHRIIDSLKHFTPQKGDLFLAVSDEDLIGLLKYCARRNWKPGKDIGIISYDETPLKGILAGGISVITTDFVKMGRTAAAMIKGDITGKTANPCRFILRNSL
jgi:DNA-binding transcriptional regulator YhcF (GntR family)